MIPDDSEKAYPGLPLRLDQQATSADPNLPAFLARPEGSPVYHGFPVLNSTPEGWNFGTVSGYSSDSPAEWGDAFVVAPDGRRAGIVWALDTDKFYQIMAPDSHRWGVYGLRFEHSVASDQDLIEELIKFLPLLRQKWEETSQ